MSGAKRLEDSINTTKFSAHFSISHPAELQACYLEVQCNNDNFKAELPFLKDAKITNNNFDVSNDEKENEKLFDYVKEIYKHLFSED